MISAKDTIIKIGDKQIPATSVRISESSTKSNIKSVGQRSSGFVAKDRVSTNFAINLLYNGEFDYESSFDLYVGDQFLSGCEYNYYSLEIQPYSPVTCTINGISPFRLSDTSNDTLDGFGSFAHGAASEVSGIAVFSGGQLSASYSKTRNVSPSMQIGSYSTLLAKDFSEIEEVVRMAGDGITGYIDEPCPDRYNVSITLNDVCGNLLGSLSVTGMEISEREIAIEEDLNIVTNLTAIKYS